VAARLTSASGDAQARAEQAIHQLGDAIELRRLYALAERLPADVRMTPGDLGGIPVIFIDIADVEPRGTIFHIHGGGFALGSAAGSAGLASGLARKTGMRAVSVDYRLAPENKCPAALDDVEAGFYYAIRNSAELNVDVGRIAVMGRDAGAALVAGLTQRMFDDEGPQILVQILHQPMLDSDATPSRREFQRTPGLNGPAVSRAWNHYLGHASASGQHVPAHRANLEGLPPTFISCSEIDPCRDEAIDYANRLLHAYVHTELHVIAAAFNGFDTLVPDWDVSQENRALHARSLRRVFAM